MKIQSIRRFLMVGLLSIMLVADLISMVWSYRASYHEAEELQDAQLVQYARALSLLYTDDAAKEVITIPILSPPEQWQGKEANTQGHKYEGKLFFQIFNDQRQLVVQSINSPAFFEQPVQEGFSTITTGGENWRIFALHLLGRWIITAQRGDIRGEMGMILALKGVFPFLLTLPVALLLIGRLIRHGLQPIRQLADELAQREADDLRPVPLHHPPEEVLPLILSTNQLFKRLSNAFNRERRFVGDAAHELRTPLAGLGVHLQHASQVQGNKREEALLLAQEGHQRMVRLVEQLLVLARTTPDVYSVSFQPVDLERLCQKVIGDAIQLILDKHQQITLECKQTVSIHGDSAGLAIMISNLLRNASLYTPESGIIQVSISKNGNNTVLRVCDSGPGIPVSQRERVFDRFHRVSSDRHSSGVSGSGLGLSIVAHIVELHDAVITLADAGIGGLEVTIRFPADNHAIV